MAFSKNNYVTTMPNTNDTIKFSLQHSSGTAKKPCYCQKQAQNVRIPPPNCTCS